MVGLAWRSRPGEQSDPCDHHAHAKDLPPADPLPQHARADHEQYDEAHRESRLDQRQGDEEERSHLRHPAEQREPGADQPARLRDQPPEQGEAEMLLLRGLAGFQRLQADRRGVEDRSREGKRETGDDDHEQA
jgi:hypothetical protein